MNRTRHPTPAGLRGTSLMRSSIRAAADVPEDPWLGPDVCEYLRDERQRGLEAAVIVPIGFICDHVEVLYDLDVEAADVCREIGLPMVRAQAVNDHPLFIDMPRGRRAARDSPLRARASAGARRDAMTAALALLARGCDRRHVDQRPAGSGNRRAG